MSLFMTQYREPQVSDRFAFALLRPWLDQMDMWRSDDSPRFEIDETDQHFVVSFEVPGVSLEDLTVEVANQQLVVSGLRHREGASGRRTTQFRREFTLPDGVSAEMIVAEHKHGILRLAIKKPDAIKPQKITIVDGESQIRSGGFFKSLVGEKKGKTPVNVRGATSKEEPAAIAN